MTKPLAILCRTKRHCVTCRATGGDGPAFRASQEGHYQIPEGWACPNGLPWDWRPDAVCGQCGAGWHTTDSCPIDPDARPTAADATRGSCCDPGSA